MSERLLAGLFVAAVAAPLCLACVLGPAVIASIFAGIAAWFNGIDAIAAAGLILAASLATYGAFRMRGSRRNSTEPTGEMS